MGNNELPPERWRTFEAISLTVSEFTVSTDRALVAKIDGFSEFYKMSASNQNTMKNSIYCDYSRTLMYLGCGYEKKMPFDQFPHLNYPPEDCKAFIDWMITLGCLSLRDSKFE